MQIFANWPKFWETFFCIIYANICKKFKIIYFYANNS